MSIASITELKKHLSRFLDEVQSGTTILILNRGKPVARLEPVAAEERTNEERTASLVRAGLAVAPRKHLDVHVFLSRNVINLPPGASAVKALLSERDAG